MAEPTETPVILSVQWLLAADAVLATQQRCREAAARVERLKP